MLLYWLPYLELDYTRRGPREFRIGKAVFFEDTTDVWTQIIGRPRPSHLDIHRNFPRSGSQVGDPLYGTLLRSEDDEWLTEHVDSVVAVLYFLGDDEKRPYPTECFTYHRFTLSDTPVGGSDLVRYWTKHGSNTEASNTIVLYPPLVTRGRGSHRPRLDEAENKKLLDQFDADPYHRLVVAVRHYFRSQFADAFTSPAAEDYALHCGAIEAAFGIDALRPGVSDRFVAALVGVFGNHERYEQFFLGLYVARSLFVHGSGLALTNETGNKKLDAYRMFKGVHCKLTLVRRITREVIVHALGQKHDGESEFWRLYPAGLTHLNGRSSL